MNPSPLLDVQRPLRESNSLDLLEQISAAGLPPFLRYLNSAVRFPNTPLDPFVATASRLILARWGAVSITRLSQVLGVSRQHFRSRFEEATGLSPKMYCRIARVQQVIGRVRSGDDHIWSSIAAELGYFDQSHMIGEIRSMTGVTPRALCPSPPRRPKS
jgi:AraC-like DNA-binding protein